MIPVVTCCSTDEVLRSTLTGELLLDVPGAVVIGHDIDHEAGTLRRRVHDATGTLEDRTRALAHACLGCALREDIVPAIREVALRRPTAIVLALPVSAEPVPVLNALLELVDARVIAIGAVLTVLEAENLVWDVCGDDLLGERGLALSGDDDRSLGEVLAHQIEGADVVVTDAPPDALGDALLTHLIPASASRMLLHEVDASETLRARDPAVVARRGNPAVLPTPNAPEVEGVWTVTLESWRPFHPDRLRENLARLAAGPGRSRGVFWLPTRPESVCHWEGAGGQLSLGGHMTWSHAGCEPCTRLLVTGVEGDADEVRAVFDQTLLTDAELAAGLAGWAGLDDGYDPWLGARSDAA